MLHSFLGLFQGSSPHVRGAQGFNGNTSNLLGIIPACAGSTGALSLLNRLVEDHPRMCGEHFHRKGCRGWYGGSSPHVRGAPFAVNAASNPFGIIPACAGSTGR